MSDFLPQGYKVPDKPSDYMKFPEGSHKFRILSSPTLGWEVWAEGEDGKRTVKRVPYEAEHPQSAKHFWAMVVYNYELKRIQLLSINQSTLQESLKALAMNEDWGSPLAYDITVVRTGKTMNDTKYSLTPSPQKPLLDEVKAAFDKVTVTMDAWMNGGEPFAKDKTETSSIEDFPNNEEADETLEDEGVDVKKN